MRRRTPTEERLQKLYGLTDDEIKKIRKSTYELEALSESGIQFLSEDLYKSKVHSILKKHDIIGVSGAGETSRERIFPFAPKHTGQSFMWKDLQRQSRRNPEIDVLTLDGNGEMAPIEDVNRFGEYDWTYIDPDPVFMPSPLVQHNPFSLFEEDRDGGDSS